MYIWCFKLQCLKLGRGQHLTRILCNWTTKLDRHLVLDFTPFLRCIGLVFLQFLHNHPKKKLTIQKWQYLHHLKAKLIETPDFSGKVIVITSLVKPVYVQRWDFLVFGLVNSKYVAASSQEFTRNQKWCSEISSCRHTDYLPVSPACAIQEFLLWF